MTMMQFTSALRHWNLWLKLNIENVPRQRLHSYLDTNSRNQGRKNLRNIYPCSEINIAFIDFNIVYRVFSGIWSWTLTAVSPGGRSSWMTEVSPVALSFCRRHKRTRFAMLLVSQVLCLPSPLWLISINSDDGLNFANRR